MNKYIQEDKIQSLIRKLNATYPDVSQWTKRRAQKKHIDMFEQVINEGELYFRLKIDNNYSNDLKLSCMSMDKFLFTLIELAIAPSTVFMLP